MKNMPCCPQARYSSAVFLCSWEIKPPKYVQLKTVNPTKVSVEPSLTCHEVANILTVHDFNDVGLSYYWWHANSIPPVSEWAAASG